MEATGDQLELTRTLSPGAETGEEVAQPDAAGARVEPPGAPGMGALAPPPSAIGQAIIAAQPMPPRRAKAKALPRR